jgi:hypothetical protein
LALFFIHCVSLYGHQPVLPITVVQLGLVWYIVGMKGPPTGFQTRSNQTGGLFFRETKI